MENENSEENLVEILNSVLEKVEAWEKKQTQQKLTEKFKVQLCKMEIPLKYSNGIIVDSEDQIEGFIKEVKKRYLLDK